MIAIGDDDQSIYGWRQAAPIALLEFCTTFGAPGFELSLCFRCGESILEPARAVIGAAPGRPPKTPLQSCRDDPGTFAHLHFPTSVKEFDGVARLVRARIDSGVEPNQIAVLVRSSADRFRDELQQRLEPFGIRVTNPEWVTAALEEAEVRRLLALARLLDIPDDSIAWLAYLVTTEGIGLGSLARIYLRACNEGITFYDALNAEHEQDYPSLVPAVRARVRAAVESAHEEIRELHGEREGASLGNGGWGTWLLDRGDASRISDDARRVFEEVGRQLMNTDESDLVAFLNHLPSMALDLADDEEGAIRLMTMARSKGLTVNTAILVAVDDSILPAARGEEIEERRILYVAMTRATDYSVITFAQRRFGPTAQIGTPVGQRRRCRFLSGLPGIPAPQGGVEFVSRELAAEDG